jgi:hypothetical protein
MPSTWPAGRVRRPASYNAVIRLARRGESDEARTLLAAAYAGIDGGRATPDEVAAAALLRELETSR